MYLLLDNYDSFTYNVYQLMAELGAQVEVARNDAITVAEVMGRSYEGIVISPGPGTPAESGITEELIRAVATSHEPPPLLGICLGHQAIGEVFGGTVVRAGSIVHGKTSLVRHCGTGIYAGLPSPFEVGRYHSLIVDRASVPGCLDVTAELDNGIVMGLRHKTLPIEGIQFHPESILTPLGKQLMRNWLDLKTA